MSLHIPNEIKYAVCTFSKAVDFLKRPCSGHSSVLVALFPYFPQNTEGNISLYARGLDYHLWVKNALIKISKDNEAQFGKATPFVDSAIFHEKRLAEALCLGEIGKSSLLLSREFGSFAFIGGLLIEKPLQATQASPPKICTSCGNCIAACPTGALSKSGFNRALCLSELTQKKQLSLEDATLLKKGSLVWGCDLCQLACPANILQACQCQSDNHITSLRKSDLDGLSEAEFQEKFGGYAFSWRGAEVIRRNLDILG